MDALGASKNEKSKSKSERIGGGQLPAMAIHHYTYSHHWCIPGSARTPLGQTRWIFTKLSRDFCFEFIVSSNFEF